MIFAVVDGIDGVLMDEDLHGCSSWDRREARGERCESECGAGDACFLIDWFKQKIYVENLGADPFPAWRPPFPARGQDNIQS